MILRKIRKGGRLYELLFRLREVFRYLNFFALSALDPQYLKPKKHSDRISRFPENTETVIFISARDNYRLLYDLLLPVIATNFPDYQVCIIDDNSTEENIEAHFEYLRKINITLLKNEKAGLQWGLKTLLNHLDCIGSDAKCVLHLTHDNYPLGTNAAEEIDRLTDLIKTQNFAIIGFNQLDYRLTRDATKRYKRKSKPVGLLGRTAISALSDSGWYDSKFLQKTVVDSLPDIIHVEAVSDMSFLVSRDALNSTFEPRDCYRLHLWADDLCLQFLKNNLDVGSATRVYFFNCQELKRRYGISVDSVRGSKLKTTHFSDYGPHFKCWREAWGWERNHKNGYVSVKHMYENTLLDDRYKETAILYARR